jgi:hypothetical protein
MNGMHTFYKFTVFPNFVLFTNHIVQRTDLILQSTRFHMLQRHILLTGSVTFDRDLILELALAVVWKR